jgi:hypothetical protein
MARLLSVVVMAGVVLFASSTVISTAFTTSEVQRNADFSVEADAAARIQVTPGSGAGATVDSEGTLQLSLTNLNKDSSFTFGDTSDPSRVYVFKFTNNNGTDHTFTVGATNIGNQATFYVKDPNNSSEWTFTAPGTSSGFTLDDGQTAYVAVDIVDTGTANFSGSVYINDTGDGGDNI